MLSVTHVLFVFCMLHQGPEGTKFHLTMYLLYSSDGNKQYMI